MGVIKIDKGLFIANANNRDVVSCPFNSGFGCNTTSSMLFHHLDFCASNIRSFYKGATCVHGKPMGNEAMVAYLLDNYYEHALKFTDTGSALESLLKGSVAMIYIQRGSGLSSQFDIWNGHQLMFEKEFKLPEMHAPSVWVWTMGAVQNKIKDKHKRHHKGVKSQKHSKPAYYF